MRLLPLSLQTFYDVGGGAGQSPQIRPGGILQRVASHLRTSIGSKELIQGMIQGLLIKGLGEDQSSIGSADMKRIAGVLCREHGKSRNQSFGDDHSRHFQSSWMDEEISVAEELGSVISMT